jgi:predicted RNA-binding protein YlxR (DUF448 family)
MRTCIVTRETLPQWQLLRFVVEESSGIVYLDLLHKLPGRGAYLFPSRTNLTKAIKKGGFARAFKGKVQANEEQLWQDIQEAVTRRFTSLLSIAKRAGALCPGHSQVEQMLRKEEGVLLLIANDASEGVKTKFQRWSLRNALPVVELLSKDEIAHSTGLQPTSLVMVQEEGFSRTLRQEAWRAEKLGLARYHGPQPSKLGSLESVR